MPERPGDMSIEERVNAGISDLTDFMPDDTRPGADAYTNIVGSPLRQSLINNKRLRDGYSSMRRDDQYVVGPGLPEHVISGLIEVDGKMWDYKTETNPGNLVSYRRVFTMKDQFIELDVDESLRWMSAHEGSERYTELRKQLEEETSMENVNNQVILQLMYDRVERGESLLPRGSNKLVSSSQ
ncbi:hypothetical protein CMI43_02260 [Candidatus Pacearchaeota archaeon]|jgi:hypothetical protein|nr:hypothetical protein [Candidatus Pacearchaeota archaeon]|tara:strand:- start:8466 stop:9014 length:549 start_codon:yes stop_codon:yes gene_type:complete